MPIYSVAMALTVAVAMVTKSKVNTLGSSYKWK